MSKQLSESTERVLKLAGLTSAELIADDDPAALLHRRAQRHAESQGVGGPTRSLCERIVKGLANPTSDPRSLEKEGMMTHTSMDPEHDRAESEDRALAKNTAQLVADCEDNLIRAFGRYSNGDNAGGDQFVVKAAKSAKELKEAQADAGSVKHWEEVERECARILNGCYGDRTAGKVDLLTDNLAYKPGPKYTAKHKADYWDARDVVSVTVLRKDVGNGKSLIAYGYGRFGETRATYPTADLFDWKEIPGTEEGE